MENNLELRERLLNLMDKNLEIRLNIYRPVEDTIFEKFFKWIKLTFKSK